MRVALIEWLLLSKTSLIVHPFWSSFGEEASLVHLIPRLMVCHVLLMYRHDH